MGHDHSHAAGRAEDRARLRLVLVITATVMIVELIGAWVAGSLALLADAGHMATDAAAIVLALGASYVATRPAGPRSTFGLHRAEILAAMVNALVLLVVCGYLAYAGISRLAEPDDGRGRAADRVRAGRPGGQRRLAGDPEPVRDRQPQPPRRRHRGARRPARVGARGRGRRRHLADRLPAGRPDRLTGDRGADPAAVAAPAEGLGRSSCSRSPRRASTSTTCATTSPAYPVSSTSTTSTPGRSPAACRPSPRTSPSPTPRSTQYGVGGILDRLCQCTSEHFDIDHATFQVEPETHREHEDLGEAH